MLKGSREFRVHFSPCIMHLDDYVAYINGVRRLKDDQLLLASVHCVLELFGLRTDYFIHDQYVILQTTLKIC